MTIPTLARQLERAQRKLAHRQRMYPRWVEQGRISVIQAVEELFRQHVVCARLAARVEQQPTKGEPARSVLQGDTP